MNERELLKKILNTGWLNHELSCEAEELLAQPEQTEQKPVAWMQDDIELYVLEEKDIVRGYVIPLYTAPPKQEPLSDEEVFDIAYKAGFAIDHDESADYESEAYGFLNGDGYVDNEPYFKLVKAIEKAHGIGVSDDYR